MGYQIYKYFFIFACFLVYIAFTSPIFWVIDHFFKLPSGITTLFYVAIYILSIFQSRQAVDIYYATEMKFWRALYLSFCEFWGILFLQLRGSKKEIPDKLEIDEQTIHSENRDKE